MYGGVSGGFVRAANTERFLVGKKLDDAEGNGQEFDDTPLCSLTTYFSVRKKVQLEHSSLARFIFRSQSLSIAIIPSILIAKFVNKTRRRLNIVLL